jgi:hypothetical protein
MMTVEEKETIGWDKLVGKLVAFNLPLVVLTILFSRYPRIAWGGGILIGAIIQNYVPPRGKNLPLILLLSLASAVLIALIPASIF